MDFPYGQPLLLDGVPDPAPSETSPEERYLNHPDVLAAHQKTVLSLGADTVFAPTFAANEARLSRYGLGSQAESFCRQLTALTKENAGSAPVGGGISWAEITLGTEEEHTFSELMGVYDDQAAYLKAAEVDYFFIRSMPSLTDVRAAVLACRKMKLPILATVTVDEEGLTPSDTTALTCLVVLQELGITAFGLSGDLSPDQMCSIFDELTPFAKIPLIAMPSAASQSPKAFAEGMTELFKKGVRYAGGNNMSDDHLTALRRAMDAFDFESVTLPRHSRELVLTSVHETFCYDLDMLEFSPTLVTDNDMTDDFIEVEDESYDIISVEINTPDDAYAFAESDHMAELPVSFLSHDELALKTALLLYCGRAMVDSQSTIERETLEKIAKKYGAVVY